MDSAFAVAPDDTDPNDAPDDVVPPLASSSDAIVLCDSHYGLASIRQDDTDLVIWQRQMPVGFGEWLAALDPALLPDFRILVAPDELPGALALLLNDCEMPAGPMRDLFIEDISRIAGEFADVTDSDLVDVRLERVQHDACWKFHRDTVEARLVTSYRGPSTQWVASEYEETALAQQRDYDGPINDLELFDVALFKGKTAGPDRGVLHRSPPVAGTGVTRLLLCLNKQTVTSPPPWHEDW